MKDLRDLEDLTIHDVVGGRRRRWKLTPPVARRAGFEAGVGAGRGCCREGSGSCGGAPQGALV